MSASYLRRGLDRPAVFELFARHLPPNRDWLLAAGLGPSLRLITELRFGPEQLAYLGSIGFEDEFCDYLSGFRFSGNVDAMPEGTLCFAAEPLVRVTAPRIEAQLVETLLLNQINFQTMIATKAARVALAAGGGEPGAAASVIDFSPRRDHGIDAAMKVARSAAVAGVEGTSNVAAAMRYGLEAVGTMAHSYVLSFESEPQAFRAFLEDHPERGVLLVDTYDSLRGVENAAAAARETGVPLAGIRLDSGDLLELSRGARRLLDEAGLAETRIAASGDLEERRICELVAAGAPIDLWGVGTDLGTSRDSPVVNGVYKLVADAGPAGGWRDVAKHSPDKATVGGAKQVHRRIDGGRMAGDTIVAAEEEAPGEALLVPAVRKGEIVRREQLASVRARATDQLRALPDALRLPEPGAHPEPYPVELSPMLARRAGLSSAPG
ncbi:MAG: nicotinate phosphoribosyltransferase [Solirubrobacterales bacterium]|nr:nicotinate phosphoribosyltransferase [Solirubrobacterales bacterium]